MKRKFLTTAVTALLATSMLSACGMSNKVTFMDFWKKSVAESVINTVTEVSEYNVSFTEGSNTSFSVAYQNGTYKTTFISEMKDQKIVYTYTTEFSIQVQYTCAGETSEWLNDSVTTTVSFQSSNNGLKPISSEKHGINHSPLSIGPATITTAYKKYDMSLKTIYDETCENATSTITDNLLDKNNVTTNTFTVSHDSYNYLDNEQLLFAIRCLNLAENTSAKFRVYSPFANTTQKIKASCGAEVTKDFTFAIGGESATRNLAYYPVTVQLSAKNNNTGTPKTLWIAKTTDAQNNTYRNAMLRQEIPLSFNLGTLVFELKNTTFAQ